MHPLHFHLGTVQVINRVGWDNFVTPPELNELGWKETVKVNPLEDLIVAVRPRKPATGGFGLPNSVRLLDPTQSEGALTGFTQIDVNTGLPTPVANVIQDFGWEYSWHTQVLSRVANDMARPVVFNANEARPAAATGLGGVVSGTDVVLNWTDVSTTEFQYRVERSGPGLNVWLPLATILANATTYTDSTAGANAFYDYRVVAIGQAGETASNVASVMPVPTAPGNLQAARAGAPVSLSWTDASFETSYLVQRSVAGGNSWSAGVTLNAGNTSYTDSTALANTAYDYRVTAINAAGQTVSNTASVAATQVAALPGAPTGLTVTKLGNTGFLNLQANVRVSWTAPTSGGAVTSYTVQRCVGANCTNFGNQSTSATSPYQQTVVRGVTYRYRVLAVNPAGSTVSTTVVNIAP
jgi:fibronectin type 3 domain-containing protein